MTWANLSVEIAEEFARLVPSPLALLEEYCYRRRERRRLESALARRLRRESSRAARVERTRELATELQRSTLIAQGRCPRCVQGRLIERYELCVTCARAHFARRRAKG